jgi:hypothetical protein
MKTRKGKGLMCLKVEELKKLLLSVSVVVVE